MKAKILHKIVSPLLALLVMLSTVSFTIEKHFCGDILVDVSIFYDVEKCAMESMEILQKKSCCKDEIEIIQGQDELKVSVFEDFEIHQQIFLNTFVYTYINLFENLDKNIVPHKDYSPPNLVADIQVLDQVFII